MGKLLAFVTKIRYFKHFRQVCCSNYTHFKHKTIIIPLKTTEQNNANRGLEPSDYYYNEQGFMVFTKEYHLKRGYCCKNGCKHCPYGFKKPKAF
ncbi:DUF5522 domain-containing protein [Flectobacillus major]|uniref:DUF5522 domain-containing protein n=1 Tax=Flectobacillus major TaxID=103 RepID=UPI00040C14F5|nr:DUF5522 domain-containing protein [Flectobacillus major]